MSFLFQACRKGENKYDLISFFLETSPETSQTELREIAMNFILAGRDTTAVMLSWFFYEILRHPEIEKKILSEINEICGKNGDQKINFQNVKNLNYLEASVPATIRVCVKKPKTPSGFTIEKGQVCAF